MAYVYITPQDQLAAESDMRKAAKTVKFLRSVGSADYYTDAFHPRGGWFAVPKGTPLATVKAIAEESAGYKNLYHIREAAWDLPDYATAVPAVEAEIEDFLASVIAQIASGH